uniref:Uncharacterized protein n=1 Tax=Brassica campestris TaxID=3711 RepID=A0A3P6BI64_BRACM|nr:unnamed protein product [Brassica rapa]
MGLSCSSEQVVEELPTHDPDKVGMVMTLVLLLSWNKLMWCLFTVAIFHSLSWIISLSQNIRCFSDLHHRHTSRSQFQEGSTCDALLGILSQLNFGGQALTLPDRLVPSLRASSSFTTYATQTLHYLSVFVAFKE